MKLKSREALPQAGVKLEFTEQQLEALERAQVLGNPLPLAMPA
jgi:hypothetical protein